jgi:hypothetical protein
MHSIFKARDCSRSARWVVVLNRTHDSEDQKQPVNAEKLNEVKQHVADPVNQDNQGVQEYLNYVWKSEGSEMPTDWKSALNLYTQF